MTTRELIKKAKKIYYAGMCECGERKFDLSCGDIHRNPELLEEAK